MKKIIVTAPLLVLTIAGCPKAETGSEQDSKAEKNASAEEAPQTALSVIRDVEKSLEADCGKGLSDMRLENLESLELAEEDREEAEKSLQNIGLMAQQCGNYDSGPLTAQADTCNPDCSWCPVKWYWCIYNGGACAGGDNESCCKLGACGSKHHCEDVCKSSCGCDVPPLPSDGGGDGGDD